MTPKKQAEAFSPEVKPADYAGRESVAQLPLVTIDGETARDFDDAVYCEPNGKGFRLVVAIADVSAYVKSGDALDKEAINRGNSVYFPRRVIPMLPEELSNGLCSLNPNVERLCMVCDMQISAEGEIQKHRFYPSVMFSHARLTYTQVADMLANPQGENGAKVRGSSAAHQQPVHAVPDLVAGARETRCHRLRNGRDANDLQCARQDRKDRAGGAQRRAQADRGMHAGGQRVCCGFPERASNIRCCTASTKARRRRSWKRCANSSRNSACNWAAGTIRKPADYSKLLKQIKGRPDAGLLQTVMLRSLRQAVYAPENLGHFGLGYEAYAHFTSPIRRYPDLLVHRAIKAVLEGKQYKPQLKWAELGVHCSMTERRADDATRDVEAWLKCFYMRDHLGSVFDGTISSVTGFGLFVSLDDLYVEGLVHVSELGADYYHFDAAKHQMLGERTGKRYRLGDRVKVKVVRVDMESTKIDFVLEGEITLPDAASSKERSISVHGARLHPRKPNHPGSRRVRAGKRHG